MRNHEETSPWDDGEYNTGRTKPPKSHRTLIAVLLVLVIVLTGLSTLLGFSSIRLFQQLNSQSAENDATVCYNTVQETTAESSLVPVETTAETAAPETVAPVQETASLTLQEIYQKCIPSVASITTTTKSGSATGTGVILSSDGYIVTNYHVIEDGVSYTVQLTDDRILSANLIGDDPTGDLAVLKVEADDLVSAEFGDSDTLQVGDSVVAIGDPLGVEYRGTMTNGIVSAINRNVNVNGRTMNLIQTNAALNSGNSGGPLINDRGQVVGINTVKIGAFEDKAGVEGLGFAIPSTIVKDIVTQIISQGYVSGRPWLGITGESLSLFYQRYYRLPAGLYISEVEEGSSAAKAGIAVGDILLSIDDTSIYSQSDLETLLYSYSAGDSITIVIYRSGFRMQATVTLEEARSAT